MLVTGSPSPRGRKKEVSLPALSGGGKRATAVLLRRRGPGGFGKLSAFRLASSGLALAHQPTELGGTALVLGRTRSYESYFLCVWRGA